MNLLGYENDEVSDKKRILNTAQKLISHPKYEKYVQWGKIITLTGGTQAIIQAIGLVSGILVIRLLPTQEYAYYTIANTMLGMMTVLADGGISSGTMAEGGKVWQDKKKLGAVLATSLSLRKIFALGSLIIMIPMLVFLLIKHDAPIWICTFIVIALIPVFFSTLTDTIYQTALKLHQEIKPLQRNQFLVALNRLILTAFALFVWPWTFIALLSNGIPRVYGNIRLKRLSEEFVEYDQSSDPAVRNSILKIIHRILPTAIYYCISGQITIWLISFFGNTSSLASFGALGRVTASFSIVTTIFGTLLVPRFAKLSDNPKILQKYFLRNQLFLFITSLFLFSLVYLFSGVILFILGPEYQSLSKELLLISISACFNIIGQSTNSIMASKGLILPPTLLISTTLIVQVGAAFVFPISELNGVILYGLTTTVIIYLIRIIYFQYIINNYKKL